MKLDKTFEGQRRITFRCDAEYFSAVRDGRKTAEARLMSRQECIAAFGTFYPYGEISVEHWNLPSVIRLLHIAGDDQETLERRLTYMAAVGHVLGSTLILFCFEVPS